MGTAPICAPVLGPPLLPNSHSTSRSCHSPQVALDQQQQLPRCPPAHPGRNSELVMTVLLSDSIANPRLTSPSDKLGSQPRGAPAAFEVPERKKVKNFKRRRLCKPRQLLTARWETKNGKLDTAQLLLSSLQSSGNESSKIDSCGKPDWWFSLMGRDTQGQMWKMLFK